MERHARSKLNTQINEEACEWFVEYRDGDLDEAGRREFDRWLRKSPEHLSAYLEVAAIWNEGPSLDPQHKWDTDTLIAEAAEDHDNVVPLTTFAPNDFALGTSDQKMQSAGRAEGSSQRVGYVVAKRRLFAIAASIAVLSVAVGVAIWSQSFRAPAYATAIGEQRSIVLPDGSTVALNSRSRIKVRYSERERAVELLEGQALFQVAKDHARPFIVTSDETRVRAVGTQFDVYKKRGGTIVTVVEGRVAILTDAEVENLGASDVDPGPSPSMLAFPSEEKRPGSGASVFLSAGEQLTVTATTAQKAVSPNIASATAWTQRQLVFASASLAEVAEEFNRYNERQLVIQDAEIYDFHISGVFSSSDPTSLIRFLRERPGVEVIETASEIRIAKKVS